MLWTPRRAERQPSLAYTPMSWPNASAPNAATAATAGEWGDWATLASGANLPDGADLLEMTVHGPSTGPGYADSGVMEIGLDLAGGTSFTAAYTLVVGNTPQIAGNVVAWEREYLIPLRIPPGASVGARTQRAVNAATNVHVRPYFFSGVRSGAYAQTLGTPATGRGQAIVPGNSAWGSWVDLGTLSRSSWWWQLGWSIYDSSIANNYYDFQLAYGDGTSYVQIGRWYHKGMTSEYIQDLMARNKTPANCYCEVPAGATIYLRAYGYNTSPDANIYALALAVGGG